jgi:hypothetical protein
MEEGRPFSGEPSIEDLTQRPASGWIDTIADARALPSDDDPAQRAILKQNIRLAFVAILQKPEATRHSPVDGCHRILGGGGSRNSQHVVSRPTARFNTLELRSRPEVQNPD